MTVHAGQVALAPLRFDQRRQLTEADRAVGSHRVVPALDDRDLRDDALDAPVERADRERVPAAVGNPPDPDPLGIDLVCEFVQVAHGVDRASIVGDLLARIQMLARFAVARAEMPVVENQRGAAGGDEVLRVLRHDEFLDVAPASAHDDDGPRPLPGFGQVKVRANRLVAVLAWKFDLSFQHRVLRYRDLDGLRLRPIRHYTRVRPSGGRRERSSLDRLLRTALKWE